MSYTTLDYQIDDRILTITLNRPDKMNAFTVTMANELVDAFNRASADDEVGAVIVTGAGRAFCAGMDLSVAGNVFGLDESMHPTPAELEQGFEDADMISGVRDTGGRVSLAIYQCNKPVIGAINGAAVGVGATMTLAMDVRLLSESARMGFVFGKIGIVPEACSTWFLPRLVGISQALDWVYTGELISSADAVAKGLAKAAFPADQLMTEAKKLARSYIQHRSPVAIALARQMMLRNAALIHPLEAHKVESLAVFYTSQGDGKEGIQAFLQKRDPVFGAKVSSDMPEVFP
ncbi:MAG: crotonase/enoyl-CoA hydratase family protein [Pseudohongiella sp.]|nr:crotonase/enoyl-CoA hydratase family protein [Pseudohongiella sp.]MDP2091940.1 crotonase/enoyl-CoA hydratase family protein [Pseudohongiella sp.]